MFGGGPGSNVRRIDCSGKVSPRNVPEPACHTAVIGRRLYETYEPAYTWRMSLVLTTAAAALAVLGVVWTRPPKAIPLRVRARRVRRRDDH